MWSTPPAPDAPKAPAPPVAPSPSPPAPHAPSSPAAPPAIIIPHADDVSAMRAWLRRQLAGETPLQVQGEPGARPWRGVPAAWEHHPEHGAFVREHLDAVRAVVVGGEAPPWLRSRWLEHLAALDYASRSHRGRQRLSAAELDAAERHEDGA